MTTSPARSFTLLRLVARLATLGYAAGVKGARSGCVDGAEDGTLSVWDDAGRGGEGAGWYVLVGLKGGQAVLPPEGDVSPALRATLLSLGASEAA